MKKIRDFAVLLAFGLACMPASAFETSAKQAVIMDFETGEVLFAKNAFEPSYPASMTKMMTAYMVFERLKDGRLQLDDTFTVSENAWRKGGAASGSSTMFLNIDEQVTVDELLKGVIIQSGNDACIVLAEGISGSEEAFAAEMTARAKELGLDTLEFRNATGWPNPEHQISVYDLAQIAELTIRNFPEFYEIYSISEFTHNGIRQYNRNPILSSFQGTDGLKTGHTEASGYGLTASAEVDGERRIVVLNGLASETDRATESERLMRSAFREFSIARPFTADDVVAEVPVWLGKQDTVPVLVAEDLVFGYTSVEKAELSSELVLNDALRAPIAEGQVVGSLVVTGPSGEIKSVPVVAGATVEKKGLLAQALQGIGVVVSPSRGATEPEQPVAEEQ